MRDFTLINKNRTSKPAYKKGFSFSEAKVWMCADEQVLQEETAHHGGA